MSDTSLLLTDSRGCKKQWLGFIWRKEKAATLERRFSTNIYESASTSNS